ncbi:bifunctional DNA primase/polymerase [Mycolicibacterium brisbanense]|uniref:Bifunctional DNA primase/polymerase domain protein n=1 Tax=Mycolicibacterium brisbanense TaxID=146020 RepID=A0A124E0G8_9MYCO|nr:bifunctional DNA primase/polymerase [Mycolicibacterium brisbanense]MCV7158464.1 bifunctional DNA primase/polymerase [Mycolicibacterium brisbanense]GAS90484.1 bifunctional DNA primase/polymerase domain protein [Mycolicibacterium brisbanense]
MSPKENEADSTGKGADRATELTALLGDAPADATDHEAVGKFIRRLAEAGCAVLFIVPGSKLPADMRTPQRRNADDRAAQEAAREAGRRDWKQVRSPAGLALATTDVDTLDGCLARYVKVFASRYPDGVPVNLAVEVGGSGLVVVDCDTAAQMERWFGVAEVDPDTAPTVRSPGQIGPDGTMVHSDGGHYWFVVPDGVELPDNPGAMTWAGDDDGFAVLWNRRYALIPPSVRAEGPYTVTGEVYGLPDWLAEAMTDAGRLRAERADRSRAGLGGGDSVQKWGAQTTWAEILAATEWTPTGKTDGCGCETWTAPGTHASTKSATAHEPGCAFNDSPDPHLQVWTDHDADPFEEWRRGGEASFPVSRLQAVTSIHYDNNLGAAMAALSDAHDTLALDDAAEVAFLDTYRKAKAESADVGDETDAGPGGGLFVDVGALLRGGGAPKAVPSVLTRSDGKCLFYRGKTNLLFGDPETAKTWIALAAGAEELCSGGRFVFIDMDHNGVDTTIERLRMMGVPTELLADPSRFLYVEPEDKEHLGKVIGYLERWSPGVALLDSVGELLPLMGLNSNSNDEVTTAFNFTAGALAKAGAAVVLIDHLAKNADSRRLGPVGAYGKTRIFNGAMVRVFRVEQFTPGEGGVSSLWVHKDRPGAVRRETAPPDSDDADDAEIKRDNLRRWGVFKMTSTPVHDAEGVLVRDAEGYAAESLSWTIRPPKGLHGAPGGVDMPDPRKGGRPKGGKTVDGSAEYIAEDSRVYRLLVEAQRDGKFDKKPSIKAALQTIEVTDNPAPRAAAKRWLGNGCPDSFGPRDEAC